MGHKNTVGLCAKIDAIALPWAKNQQATMLKNSLFILLLIVCASNKVTIAQQQRDSSHRNNNAIYLELGGTALIYSFGYERTWYQSPRFAAMTSLGISYIPDRIGFTYIEPGILIKHKRFALELGTAFTYYIEGVPPNYISQTRKGNRRYTENILLTPRIGIRYSSKNQRWFLRTGFTPIKEIYKSEQYETLEKGFFPWLNVLTVGYRF